MITVGICKEIFFLARVFNHQCTVTISGPSKHLYNIRVYPNGVMDVWYRANHIWNESVGDESYFGVESCDSISRIVACIDHDEYGDSWKKYYYNESEKTS